ncbi:hypothetical protein HYH03_016317 [Edaphochlamys debaryana]|uniref:AF4/FMR2 C-terminal homology domain-containing protein n=1 Tax=Edaphochlamys debaryana TaxID=47281 RepID=A0A836BQ19_9CHLO|nr:hypothetical protein HYH03_016317 [Edaphochlamys debaryana]|eukprot:KAG2484931.1 hypothetical protein HYH03_016317 [Edaphochlamys debaryana]
MAEPRPANGVRRIKLKVGGAVLATKSVRTGLTSAASLDSKDAKSGIALARLRQAALQGYVPPSSSPDEIVARLRAGEGFAPGEELPAWDLCAPSPVSHLERAAKRQKLSPHDEERCAGHEESVPCTCDQPAVGEQRRFPAGPKGKSLMVKGPPATETATVVGSGESNSDQATNSQAYLPLSPEEDGAGRNTAGGAALNVSSAGQSALAAPGAAAPLNTHRPRPPVAPPPAAPAARRGAGKSIGPPVGAGTGSGSAAAAPAAGRPGPAQAPGRPASAAPPRASAAGTPAGSCSPRPAQPADRPSASDRPAAAPAASRPAGVSVETQTSAPNFPVLAPSFLEDRDKAKAKAFGGTALAYTSIGPFDLQLEHKRGGLPESRIEAHLQEAAKVKREGDALFNKNGRQWSIKALSRYVSGALMFMEAADAMLKDRLRGPSRAATILKQTADLLSHAVTFVDHVKGASVGKEALRLLAERLCAICLLRQAGLQFTALRSCADKAQLALREHTKQQAAAQAAGAAAAGGAAAGGQQPSPEDSTTSSLHASAHGAGSAGAAGGSGAGGGGAGAPGGLTGFGHDQVAELLSYARLTARFSDYMKRSAKSFEAFLERPDVRQDQQAKLVCVHLAAVCMDMGQTPGHKVIQHAREAVRTLCDDLAR